MKILSLNTQRAYQPGLEAFLKRTLASGTYDFVLLQEVNERVVPLVRDIGPYRMLDAFNEEMGRQSHLAIMYRDSFILEGSSLHSFGRMHPLPMLQHEGFGLLLGTFGTPEGRVHAGSVHLHSGWLPRVRKEEMLLLKRHALSARQQETPMLFGGDFNLGFPGEVLRACRLFSPEFVSTTRSLGPTLDSRFSEPHPNLINTSAVFLARFGIGVSLRTDHIFLDSGTVQERKVRGRVLPDRVSDHNPIELEIDG